MTGFSKIVLDRRKFLKIVTALGASTAVSPFISFPVNALEKKRFTILHTNDMHSNFVGVGPLNDYDPVTLNNDNTIGGYSRLATLIAQRKKELESIGPVLVLDAGDYSMGTAFAAATRELGAELQLMSQLGYDAVTLGNHEFDFGPDGLSSSINQAVKAGSFPTLVASNIDLRAVEPRLTNLKKLAAKKVILPHAIIDRGGIRFGIIGLMGYDATKYALDPGGVVFTDPIKTAKSMASKIREKESADVIIALSHGGVIENQNGKYTGEDIKLLKSVSDIDIVISGHTHNTMMKPELVDHRPIVQSGKYGEHLGELIVRMEGGRVEVESYRVIPVDDNILGNATVQKKVNHFLQASSAAVFASRGYRVTQPLVVIDQDWPMDYRDKESSTPLANVVTDAFLQATGADVAFTASGLIRAGLKKGNSGIQSVYDVFALAPLGYGIVDDTAGSAMVKAYFTGYELKNILEFFLLDDPVLPGQYFPRTSGLRFTYDPDGPELNMVKSIALGNLDDGYRPIDVSKSSTELYSLTCPLYAGLLLVGIPRLTDGALELVPKKKDGSRIESRAEALVDPRSSRSPFVLETNASIESEAAVTDKAQREIKEWQAIMDYFANLPEKNDNGISILKMDRRAREVRAIAV